MKINHVKVATNHVISNNYNINVETILNRTYESSKPIVIQKRKNLHEKMVTSSTFALFLLQEKITFASK